MLDSQKLDYLVRRARDAPCIESLGLRVLEAQNGLVRVSAIHDPRFNGLAPGFHGGMLANVADCVAWFAIATQTGPDEPLVTTDLHLRYLNACMTDAVATGRVIKLGKTLCPVAVEIYDTAGLHVVSGHVTYIRVGNLRGPG